MTALMFMDLNGINSHDNLKLWKQD